MARSDAGAAGSSGRCAWGALGLALALGLCAARPCAADPSDSELGAYKKLSLAELMQVEVVSVSRRARALESSPSSVQILTRDELRRAGATDLVDALRLASQLQVAQVNSSQWAISARGFSNVLSNKLLVMIDGRSVYTPQFAGVYWDVQDVLLEDVERIEVVSGPGGALWGANAVNGVIHVITRSAAETQGSFAELGAGSGLRAVAALRHGGELAPGLAYRVYGRGWRRGDTERVDRSGSGDEWSMAQGGARLDWEPTPGSRWMFQAQNYGGRPDPEGVRSITARGWHGLGRWTRQFGESSELAVQFYYDWTLRNLHNGFAQEVDTWDLDAQHSFPLGERQEIVWGLGYRGIDDDTENIPGFGFHPAHRKLALYSGFVQDEIALVRNRLALTLGSKVERTEYTGYALQPSARLAWTPSSRHTLWASVARAQRTPSRLERDFALSVPGLVVLQGSDAFENEDLLAHELGWRAQLHPRFSLSAVAFRHAYDHLRSAEPGNVFLSFPVTIANGVRGTAYGAEISGILELGERWRLRLGYASVRKNLKLKTESHDANRASAESNDAGHQLLLRSEFDVSEALELSAALRYRSALPSPHVPAFFDLDVALLWRFAPGFELALVGRSLLERRHPEFVPAASSRPREIERGLFGKITWRH